MREMAMWRAILTAFVLLALSAPAGAQGTVAQPVSGQTNNWPVSKVIGVTVYNGQGEAIGKIYDLLMDPQARVATAILSVGGYLGVGDRLVQVPLDTIRFPKEAAGPNSYPEKAVLNTSKETLVGMPPFKY
jgi:sporulation protein YlmC with PRC-barrel domain